MEDKDTVTGQRLETVGISCASCGEEMDRVSVNVSGMTTCAICRHCGVENQFLGSLTPRVCKGKHLGRALAHASHS